MWIKCVECGRNFHFIGPDEMAPEGCPECWPRCEHCRHVSHFADDCQWCECEYGGAFI